MCFGNVVLYAAMPIKREREREREAVVEQGERAVVRTKLLNERNQTLYSDYFTVIMFYSTNQ